jgi:hypothetical protein
MEEEVKEEKIVKKVKGRSPKSKAMTVMLGITFFCVLSILLLAIFDDGTLLGRNNPDNPVDKQPSETVQRKKITLECGKDSTETFNGNTIIIKSSKEENPVCKADSIMVNGIDIISSFKLDYFGVDRYEFYDKYVLFRYGNTSAVLLGVYNMVDGQIKNYAADDLEFFSISDWQSDDNGITFPECSNVKAQFMPEGESNNHNTQYAEFRMKYENGELGDPTIVREYGPAYDM